MKQLHVVPPSPEVMAMLFAEYERSGQMKKSPFQNYLKSIGFTDPAADVVGMDDAARFRRGPAGPELIEVPKHPVKGKLEVMVLLVDFPDKECKIPAAHYQDMLFKDSYPIGSMRDYYREVSLQAERGNSPE